VLAPPSALRSLSSARQLSAACAARICFVASCHLRGLWEAAARPALGYIEWEGVSLARAEYAQADAAREIPAALTAFYRERHAEVLAQRAGEVVQAGATLAALRNANVFPELGVDWGTYPNNIGHTDSAGCFRCHNGDHVAADGRKITNNCFVCHFAAAVEETEPEILQTLGLERVLQQARGK
jgi:hypothetical protein